MLLLAGFSRPKTMAPKFHIKFRNPRPPALIWEIYLNFTTFFYALLRHRKIMPEPANDDDDDIDE